MQHRLRISTHGLSDETIDVGRPTDRNLELILELILELGLELFARGAPGAPPLVDGTHRRRLSAAWVGR